MYIILGRDQENAPYKHVFRFIRPLLGTHMLTDGSNEPFINLTSRYPHKSYFFLTVMRHFILKFLLLNNNKKADDSS